MKSAAATVAIVAAIALAACGGGTETTSTSAGPSGVAASAGVAREITIVDRPPAVRRAEDMKPDAGGLVGSEPKPIVPDGPPPDFLAYQDLIKGDGKVARYGDAVSIQYVGAEYENGRQYTSSWDWGSPYHFEVGNAALLKGFDHGVEGMRVGGRRELVIPPSFADPRGTVGGIPDRETLIYVVDLLAIE
jgi:peptidylprolyl isomerase